MTHLRSNTWKEVPSLPICTPGLWMDAVGGRPGQEAPESNDCSHEAEHRKSAVGRTFEPTFKSAVDSCLPASRGACLVSSECCRWPHSVAPRSVPAGAAAVGLPLIEPLAAGGVQVLQSGAGQALQVATES